MRLSLIVFIYVLLLAAAGSLLPGCQSSEKKSAADEIEEAMRGVETGLLPAVVVRDEPVVTSTLTERMDFYNVPGVSIAVIKDGAIQWSKGYGIADSAQQTMVDTATLFQAGSISKPLAALAALRLVQEGRLDLDTDVNDYLKSWQIPGHAYTTEAPVTLRHLLTHTGGTTVHGFPGYTRQDSFPSVISVLSGKGNTPAVFVDTKPGTNWRYSGGGYTIMELLVEDVTGMPLEAYAEQFVLNPLGMQSSTFAQPLPASLHPRASAAYDATGMYIAGGWHNYPEQAAAGLWTTPNDLARYAIAMQQAYAGEDERVLGQEMVEAMFTSHQNGWGLGPALMGEGDSLRFQHGGKNAGFSNVFFAFAKKGGDGLIVMTNADQGVALMQEIQRSASSYYGWNIANPDTVEQIEVDEAEYLAFTGDYVYSGERPSMQGYAVRVAYEEGLIQVYGPDESGQVNVMIPAAPDSFIDRYTSDQIIFERSADGVVTAFVYNETYRFERE